MGETWRKEDGGTYDIRFCPVILGVLMDDPMILLPEMAIPL